METNQLKRSRNKFNGRRFLLLGAILPLVALLFTFSPLQHTQKADAAVSIGCPPQQVPGNNNDWVKVIQYKLNALYENQVFYSPNFPFPLSPDGGFGTNTYNGVVAFQRASGLTPDGNVGPMTWSMLGLCSTGSAHYASGYVGGSDCPPEQDYSANDTFVNAMQHMLNMDAYYNLFPSSQSWYPLSMDGSFGPHTLSAVEAFQKLNNLQPNGQVGPLTWGAFGMCY